MRDVEVEYQIHRHRFGWLVYGSVRVADIPALMRLVPGQDDIHDQLVAKHYSATLAICSVSDSFKWRELLRASHEAD